MTPKRKDLSTQSYTGAVVVKYKGNGAFIHGVPTRDMTPEEWELLPEHLREEAIAADLYVAVYATPKEGE